MCLCRNDARFCVLVCFHGVLFYFLPTIPTTFIRFSCLFLKVLSSSWVVIAASIVGYGIRCNGMSVRVQSIIFHEVHFLLRQLQ